MRKHKRFKKILLVIMLIGALLGVQVMEIIAYASEEGGTEDTGQQEIVQVSTFDELVSAIDTAQDGDVIGMTAAIEKHESFSLGSPDKHVTIQRMVDNAYFILGGGIDVQVQLQNITFDGNSIEDNHNFLMISCNVVSQQCNFINCISAGAGGAIYLTCSMEMTKCTFENNKANNGGHIAVAGNGQVYFKECILKQGHSTGKGGAVYVEGSSAKVYFQNSEMTGNHSDSIGGGVSTDGFLHTDDSKIYNNTAITGGADIAYFNTWENYDTTESLQTLFGDAFIIKGWISDFEDESGGGYVKLDYEEIVEEPEQPTDPSVPDDGNDGEQEEPTEPDTGEDNTDPSQPDDSDQDAGETPSDPTTPDDSEDPSTPTDPGDSETPSDPSDPGEAPGDDSGSSGDNITTDTDNSSSDTNSTDNSDHSSIKEDNSVTNTNSGNTTNSSSDHSQRTEDNSSVTYNYYYPSDSGAKDQEQQQIVIHNYIQEENPNQSQEETKSDPTDNISIDAEGVDVSFEVKDGVYSISIKAQDPEPQVQQVQQAAEEPASETSMVNWYEIIKIGLLGAIVFVVKKK